MERDYLADRLKGYACFLVLFGHVISGLAASAVGAPVFMQKVQTFLWSFHIDLWMFLAGYVYTVTGGRKKEGSLQGFLLKKLITLGVPYLAFSILYILINSLTPGVNTGNRPTDILHLLTTPVAQYWFLYALFFLFVLWAVLSLFLGNAVITIVLYVAFVLLTKVFEVPLYFLDSSLNCVLAFGLGACFPSISSHKYPVWAKTGVLVLHAGTTVLAIETGWLTTLPCFEDLVTVLGILASVFFIQMLQQWKPVSRFLEFTNRYSFPIYLLHTVFTAGVRIVLLKVGIRSYPLHIAVALAVGYAVPVLIAKIAERVWFFNFFFYPLKTVRAVRQKKKASEGNA